MIRSCEVTRVLRDFESGDLVVFGLSPSSRQFIARVQEPMDEYWEKSLDGWAIPPKMGKVDL